MSTITYDIAAAAKTATRTITSSTTAPARKRQGLIARFMEGRRRQAMLELARHGLRLPRELEEAGLKISERNEDSLPFIR